MSCSGPFNSNRLCPSPAKNWPITDWQTSVSSSTRRSWLSITQGIPLKRSRHAIPVTNGQAPCPARDRFALLARQVFEEIKFQHGNGQYEYPINGCDTGQENRRSGTVGVVSGLSAAALRA